MLKSLCIQPQGRSEPELFKAAWTTTDLRQAQAWLAQHPIEAIGLQLIWPDSQWLKRLLRWRSQSDSIPIVVLLPERWRSRLNACLPCSSIPHLQPSHCTIALHNEVQLTEAWQWTAQANDSGQLETTLTPQSLTFRRDENTVEELFADRVFPPVHPASPSFLQQLINTLPDPLFVKDDQHRWVLLNEAICKLVGYPPDELLGKSDYDYFPPAQADVFWQQDEQVFETGNTNENEEELTDSDGITHTIVTRKARMVWPNGEKLLVGTIRDVTKDKQNRQLIQQQQNYLTTIFEAQWLMLRCQHHVSQHYSTLVKRLGEASGASRVYIFENHRDAQSQLRMSQKAEWCDVGITAELDNPVYQNVPYAEFGPEFGRALARQEMVSSLVVDLPQPMREILSEHDILAILVLPITVQGEFFGFIGFDNCREAKCWSQTEAYFLQTVATAIAITQERLQAQQQYRQIVETTHEAICLLDLQGDIEFTNPQMGQLLDPYAGASSPNLARVFTGQPWINVVAADHRERVIPYLNVALTNKQTIQFDCPLRQADGSTIWTNVVATPRQEQAQVVGTLLLITDMSEGYSTKQALQRRIEIEQLVTSLSTQFMNIQSRELDQAIDQALHQIGDFTGGDRSYIFQISADGCTISNTYEWCAPTIESVMAELQDISVERFPWAISKLKNGEMIYLPDLDHLPIEAACDQAELQAQGIQAIMLVPMMLRGRFVGLIGIDIVRSPHLLLKTSLNLLRLVSEIFVGALERRRIETELQHRLQLEQVIATISTQFIQLETSGIPQGIRIALEQIGRFAGVDCAYVFQLVANNTAIQKLHQWSQEDLDPPIAHRDSVALADMPWLASQLNQHQIIHVPSLDILPPEAEPERQCLANLGVQSMLIVPMVSQGELLGFVGFDAVRTPRQWSNSAITLFRLVGEMFANALHRCNIESEIQESQERFQQLAANINSVFWMTDPQKQSLLYISPAYEQVWGYPCESLYHNPTSFVDAIYAEDRDRVIAAFPNQAQGTYNEEYRIIRPDGQTRWISDRAFPIADEQGQVYRVAGIAEDITERKRNDQLKDEFISTLSHELRTPLTSLTGALKLLHATAAMSEDARVRQLLTIAVNNSDRLGDLIQDLLDVQNFTAQEYSFQDQDCTVSQLLDTVERINTPEHSLVVMPLSESLKTLQLWVDLPAIAKVFSHLIRNSMKFSSPGSEIRLTVQPQGHNIHFAVEDAGIGIAPEHCRDIFELFRQVDSSDTRRYGGVGLGLYICRCIIEHYDGAIWVNSTLGVGSRFSFTLPLLNTDRATNPADSH